MARASIRPTSRPSKTRQALLAAGYKLLAERPIDAIPIDDLVTQAKVAKGSFFNHFEDKHAFAKAIAGDIRARLEASVGKANAAVASPIERMSRGMLVTVEFALSERRWATVMIHTTWRTTRRRHRLNRGVYADTAAAIAARLVRPEAATTGMTFWIGLYQALSRDVIENNLSRREAAGQVYNMQVLGFCGLGVSAGRASRLATSARQAVLESAMKEYL